MCSFQVGLSTFLSCACFSTEDILLGKGYFVMMYIFSVYYRRVFMNHLKLVDQKMIIIVLVLLYFLNLKIVELIPVTGHLFVSLCFLCFFFL